MKHKIQPITGPEISANCKGNLTFKANYLAGLSSASFETLSFYKGNDAKFAADVECGILIVKETLKDELTEFKAECIVFSPKPFISFIHIVNTNFKDVFTGKIKTTTNNHVNISNLAYVEEQVEINEHVTIFPNVSIFNGTKIGKNCTIQSSTVVGGNGMTYEKVENEEFLRMTQIGTVVIEDDVDIGCNTTILRGILESTIIQKGSKIGNHVNIGHNCKIGKNCYISAGAMIGGATVVEDNCWIAPGVSVRDNITIAKNCTLGVGAVVVKDTVANGIYVGNPAKLLKLKP